MNNLINFSSVSGACTFLTPDPFSNFRSRCVPSHIHLRAGFTKPTAFVNTQVFTRIWMAFGAMRFSSISGRNRISSKNVDFRWNNFNVYGIDTTLSSAKVISLQNVLTCWNWANQPRIERSVNHLLPKAPKSCNSVSVSIKTPCPQPTRRTIPTNFRSNSNSRKDVCYLLSGDIRKR